MKGVNFLFTFYVNIGFLKVIVVKYCWAVMREKTNSFNCKKRSVHQNEQCRKQRNDGNVC
ncbi:hypothetical protein SAMN05216243_0686 [Sediminibacillus albus]|uniref:Uncharacterized protein n=1 Tax=Sediminibacillus albus TaxID=407036 RepID=A0A1G8WBU4_9BACI|nr:hypothetical protein SAMN05216243_0686 [Sediminibacillus albus]